MITENKRVTINGGTPPYSFVAYSSSSCTVIQPSTGISQDGIVDLLIGYEDLDCLEFTDLFLYAVDGNGCKLETDMPVVNNCVDLEISQLLHTEPYTYTAVVSHPGCAVTCNNAIWDYDAVSFNVVSITSTDNTSTLTLRLNPDLQAIPANTPITVKVTSCHGCKAERTLYFSICQPKAENFHTNLTCVGEFYTSAVIFPPAPANCPNARIDWSSIRFEIPQGFEIQREDPVTGLTYINGGFRVIARRDAVSTGSYSLGYTVKTTELVTSTRGTVFLNVARCLSDFDLFIFDDTFVLPCDAEPGDTFVIPLEDKLFIGSEITVDWETFTIADNPVHLSESIQLFQDFVGRQFIIYTVPENPDGIGADVFKWFVCGTNGFCANAATYTIQLSCDPAPIAVGDTICSVCGQPVEINILTNDQAPGTPIQPSTAYLTTTPTKGTLSTLVNGVITYTPGSGQTGTDTFKYKVKNLSGIDSNEGTVTVNIVCAGGDNLVKLCN